MAVLESRCRRHSAAGTMSNTSPMVTPSDADRPSDMPLCVDMVGKGIVPLYVDVVGKRIVPRALMEQSPPSSLQAVVLQTWSQ